MRKLFGKALTLALLIACLIFIPSPQRTRADWASCDADRSARNDFCRPNTTSAATGCIFENGPDPLPLPVIDTARSDCMTACQDGADQIEDGVEQFHYLVKCNNYCDEHYPKP